MKFGEKLSKNSNFFATVIVQKRCVLAFVSLLQRKMQKLEFLKRRFKNTVNYSILHMWCCKSHANSDVLANPAFFGVAKTS